MGDNSDWIMIIRMKGERYRRRKYKRRCWVKPLYKNRDVDGTIFDHMYYIDVEQFQVNVLMNPHGGSLLRVTGVGTRRR